MLGEPVTGRAGSFARGCAAAAVFMTLAACVSDGPTVDVMLSPEPDGTIGVAQPLFASSDGTVGPLLATEPLFVTPSVTEDPLLPVATPGQATRTLLPNETAIPGENSILTLPGSGMFGPPSLREVLRRGAPIPAPFAYVIASDLTPLPGAAGRMGVVTASPIPGVSCALVVGADTTTSFIMRNCVNGDAREALAPLSPSIGF